MSEAFDAYRVWLGIPPESRPPTHYELLGISQKERESAVINAAVVRQSAYVRNFQIGKHAQEATRILNEIAAAKVCLLDPVKRARYDAELPPRQTDVADVSPAHAPLVPVPAPVVDLDQLAAMGMPLAPPRMRSRQAGTATPPTLGKRSNYNRSRTPWQAPLGMAIAVAVALATFAFWPAHEKQSPPDAINQESEPIAAPEGATDVPKPALAQTTHPSSVAAAPPQVAAPMVTENPATTPPPQAATDEETGTRGEPVPTTASTATPPLSVPPLKTAPTPPTPAIGVDLSEEIDGAKGGHTLAMGSGFDITKSWRLSLEFWAPTFAKDGHTLFLWGDERLGHDPIYVMLNGFMLEAAVGDTASDNRPHVITTKLSGTHARRWIPVRFVYDAPMRDLALFVDHKMVSRPRLSFTPSADRPMPVSICHMLGGARFLGRVRKVRLENLLEDKP